MSIKITLPELEVSEEQRITELRAIVKNDLDKKDGMLSKTLVFTYLNQPVCITELTKKISEYYQIEIDRSKITRAIERLVQSGALFKTTSGIVLTLQESERKPIHEEIIRKHRVYVSNLPEAFRKRFNDINYVWIVNGKGVNVLEWCCKLLNFKFEEDKDGKL